MDQKITSILDRLLALHPREIDLSLDRMHRLLADLGHPERKLPPVIHIAGTNGKGSVSATMRAILEASGKRCHVYTSPHLVSFNERMRLGSTGELVSDQRLIEALETCERINAGKPITFFEITTAVAFMLFSEEPADVLLLEVGLGGRLDATNVISKPLVSVITTISKDHENFLGNTVGEIAGEKAAITKPGCPVVVAPQVDEAMRVIECYAAGQHAPIHTFGQDFMATNDQGRLAFQDLDGLHDLPLPSLPGAHQIINAGVAIEALKVAGLLPDEETVGKGLKSIYWPGRLQALAHGPLVERAPQGAEIWLDGGHNPGAAERVAAFVADLEERNPRPLYMICGMLVTKDPAGFFKAFKGLVRHVGTVPILSSNAGREPEELAAFASGADLACTPFHSLNDALADIADQSSKEDVPPRILICGSLYLVGDVLKSNNTPPH